MNHMLVLFLQQQLLVLHSQLLAGVDYQIKAIIAPMLVSAIGILLSIAGIYMVRTKEVGFSKSSSPGSSSWYRRQFRSYSCCTGSYGRRSLDHLGCIRRCSFRSCALVPLSGSQQNTLLRMDINRPRVLRDRLKPGPATVIIEGMAVGMFSTWVPVVTIVGGIIAASAFAGGFFTILQWVYIGIGFASVGYAFHTWSDSCN